MGEGSAWERERRDPRPWDREHQDRSLREQERRDQSPWERDGQEATQSQAIPLCTNVDVDVNIDSNLHSNADYRESDVRSCHYYIDVPHAEESTYDVHERNIPIDPEFHADLEQHNNDFSHFLALPEVIPTRKKKKQQPLLDFSKSKILTSLAYTQACEEVLTQKTACEAEARRKVAEKKVNRESRMKEKEDRQREVQHRAEVRATKKRKRERLQAEKLAAGTTRRRRRSCTDAVEAATPPQRQTTPATAPHLRPSPLPVEATTPPHRAYHHNAQHIQGEFPSTVLFHRTSSGREALHRIQCQRWQILQCTTIQLFSFIYFHLDLETLP